MLVIVAGFGEVGTSGFMLPPRARLFLSRASESTFSHSPKRSQRFYPQRCTGRGEKYQCQNRHWISRTSLWRDRFALVACTKRASGLISRSNTPRRNRMFATHAEFFGTERHKPRVPSVAKMSISLTSTQDQQIAQREGNRRAPHPREGEGGSSAGASLSRRWARAGRERP